MISGPSTAHDLSGDVERRILVRTHGRVRDLQVEFGEETIVLRGWAPTYYTKQLAQHGAMDVVTAYRVVNAIEVG